MIQPPHLLRTSFLIVFILIFVSTPTLSFAASSRTYTFTENTSSQYTTTGTTTWYSPQWKYRQKVTINKESIGEDLADFPVVIRLGSQSLVGATEDRHDIVVTSSDGITKLSHELEDKNTLWIKVPKLTPTSNTDLYIYYGNPNAEDQQNVSDVWTNGYAAVYHLNNNPEGNITDSTTNDNDGTGRGGMNEGSMTDGKIGKNLTFDGSNDYINVASSGSVNITGKVTSSIWFKPQAINEIFFIKHRDVATNGDWWLSTLASGGGVRANIGPGGKVVSDPDPVELGKWHHAVLANTDEGELRLYVNGKLKATGTGSSNLTGGVGYPLQIGGWHTGSFLTGSADEARVSTVMRSSSWIRAEYLNQSNTEDFLVINSTVETTPYSTSGSSTSTIILNPTHALSFNTLLSFKSNTQPTTTFQLSNNAGTTWYFYTAQGWKSANPSNPLHRSSINDINSHLKTFPRGTGKLTFTAYIQPGSSLDSVSIGYTPSTQTKNTSSFSSTIIALNSLYRQAYNQNPSFLQWTYWAKRMLTETKTQQEWLGAMMWAAAR